MYNSTIKGKVDFCIDCPPGTPKQPVIAKRCKKIHYLKYRSEVCADKNKGKKSNSTKPIPKMSKKRKIENKEYLIKRLQFLAQPGNQRCPITGQMATEIHHMKGRIGNLLLDQKYWLAVSREGHRKIEENPEWAKEMGYSLDRLN